MTYNVWSGTLNHTSTRHRCRGDSGLRDTSSGWHQNAQLAVQ